MLASRFVIERIMKRLEEKNESRLKVLFKKYPQDEELQKIKKSVTEYFKKPASSKLKQIEKDLTELLRFRKLDSRGGSMLWFSDRRAKTPQKSR